MTNAIIIDDEPLAIQLLASYADKIDTLTVLATFTNPLEALTFLRDHKVDLIFLDVQMPELSGLQLARLTDDNTAIIFTTAYSDHAVEGFELQAIDYLVKPITLERFLKSVNRLEGRSSSNSFQDPAEEFIFIKTEYRHQKVDLNDILYLKGMGDYVSIYTKSEKVLTLENLKSFELKLPSSTFMRVHKSYLISTRHIEYIEKSRIIIGKEHIPIGATYLEAFRQRFGMS